MPKPEATQSRALFVKHILRKIFLEDWLTKLLALGITLALWVGVTGLSEVGSDRYKVPLVPRYADNIQATNELIDQVEIRITGDKRRLEQIRESDLRVFVDLTGESVGNHTVTLAPDTVTLPDLPNGVRLEDINPKRIVVRLEAIEERDVPVRVETQGDVKNGSEVYSEAIQPPTVRIRGPVSYVRSLASIPTEKIDIAGRDSDFTARQVRIAPLSNENATVLESFVDVNFRVGESRIERGFTVPIEESPGKRAQVTLFGGRSLLEGLTAKDLAVTAADNRDPQVVLPADIDGRVEVRRIKIN
jgi:YbbR domain-containing protein